MKVYKLHVERENSDFAEQTLYSTEEKALKALEKMVGKDTLEREGIWRDSTNIVHLNIEGEYGYNIFYEVTQETVY